MASKKVNKNLLPLLAVTTILLSVGLVSHSAVSVAKTANTQSVLSESDEKSDIKKEDNEVEDKSGDKEEIHKPEDKEDSIENENESEFEFEQESETESVDGSASKFKLKVKTRVVNGKPVVETISGEKEVKTTPEEVANDLVKEEIIDTPVSFEAKENNINKVEFEIQGTESKKFLGIFEVVIPKTLTVSSETGEVISTNQNIWSRILSLLSI